MKIIIPQKSDKDIIITVLERGVTGGIVHVQVENANMISGTFPVSTKYDSPIFSAYPIDEPADRMTVLISQQNNKSNMEIHVGLGEAEECRKNRINLPGINIEAKVKDDEQYLEIKAHDSDFADQQTFRLGKLVLEKTPPVQG